MKKSSTPLIEHPGMIKKNVLFIPLLLSFICFSLLNSQVSLAQRQIKITATIDTTVIRIGEQFHLYLTATIPSDAKITFPTIPDSLQKLEIIHRSLIDTSVSQDGKQNILRQSITITGFDSGFFVIEPFTFFIQQKGEAGTDSISTEALLMQVNTIPVDTAREIKDIKAPIDVPFTFKEALPYILAAIAAIALVWLLIYWLKKRKRKPQEEVRKTPLRPAHEIAIESLEKIREQKLWQQGFYKEYHSGVSDTIRAYIEHRFSITAMEMPSDDTLSHFNNNLIPSDAYEKLRNILQLADMVKFAKGIPIGTENEQSMQQAFDFIALTKQVTKEDFNEIKLELKKEDEA